MPTSNNDPETITVQQTEDLKETISSLKNKIEELNQNNLSAEEKEEKEKEAGILAEKVKQQIKEIEQNNTIKESETIKAIEEARNILENLKGGIKPENGETTTPQKTGEEVTTQEPGTNEPEQEKKGFFGKIGEGLGNMRSDVASRDKWKEQPGKNLLYTAGVGITGYAVYKGIKKLHKGVKKLRNWAFGDNEEKEDKTEEKTIEKEKKKDESSRRKKFFVGAGITVGTAVGGVEIYKHWNKITAWFKEKLGLALPFDEAKQKVEAEIRNGKIDDNHFGAFNANFDGITYDEQNQEICSYGQRTKVDKSSKKLQGLETEFSGREEMIHAANIVNFAKRMLRGRGASATPFGKTDRGGDLSFTCSANGKQEFLGMNNSNERSWILGTLGVTGGGILGAYCAGVHGAAIGAVGGGAGGYALGAYIDNSSSAGRCCSTISRGVNFDLFVNYLNRQTDEKGKSLWESTGEQHINPDDTPINGLIDNGGEGSEWSGILEELENSYGEDQSGRRNLKIDRNEDNPEEYIIGSYGHKLKLIIEGGPTRKGEEIDYNKIKKIHIEKYDKYDSWGDGLDIDFPHTKEGLKEAIKTANLTNMIVEDRKGKGGEAYPFFWGRYSTPPSLDMDVDGFRGKTILSRDAAKKFPTLFEDLRKGSDGGFGTALGYNKNHQREMHEQAVKDKSEGSQYIKFLHQIGKGRFWKNVG